MAFTTTVTAFDSLGNIATGYSGVVHFSSTDSNASVVLPADYTFVPGSDAGVHVFTGGVKLITSGSQTVTAADSANSLSGNVTVTVTANVATSFKVTLPGTSTAGNQLTAVIKALDTFGNTATGYTGVVHFSSSDAGGSVILPPNYTFVSGDSGIHTFSSGVELVTAGTQTVTAADASTGSINGSATVSVSAASATHLLITAPSPTAGVAFTITVTAQDTFNNTAPTYTGTVHFSKSDNGIGSALPSDYTFVPANAGIQTFGVTLVTSGLQSLTATDTVTASISGSAVVTVAAASATSLTVTAPAGTVAGVPFSVVVTAKDTFGNIATGYSGVVHFTKSDSNAGAAVPADYTFVPGSDAGVHTFSAGVKLATVGSQTVTATDAGNGSISGSAAVTVTPASAASLSVTAPSSASAAIPFSVTVTALDSFGNVATGYSGVVHFRTSDGGAVALPADYTFVPGSDEGVHTFANGVKLVTLGTQTVTATDTVSGSVTGTAVVTVNPPPATHFTVSAPASVSAGSFFTFTVTALDTFNATVTGYTGAVHFSTSDGNALAQVPADYTFVSSDNGVHTFTSGAKLITAGLQTIKAATKTPRRTASRASCDTDGQPLAAADLSVVAPAVPIANRGFSVTVSALDSFGNVATSYSGAIHFTASDAASGVVLPADYTYVPGDSGVHTFTGVTLQTTGLQTLTATDKATSSINGSAVVTVPVTVFMPTTLSVGLGGVVNVKPIIDVNSLKDPVHSNQGLSAASFVVFYNPAAFTVSSTDESLGSITKSVPLLQPGNKSPWDLTVTQTQPGYLSITLASHDGVHFYTGSSGGSIVTINFHASISAPLGANFIDLAANTFGGAPATGLTDQNFTDYKILPVPLDNTALNPYAYSGSDPADGTVTVNGPYRLPVAVNDSYVVTERDVAGDPGLTVAATGVLANDTDFQGFPLSVSSVDGQAANVGAIMTLASGAQLQVNADGSFAYTPAFGFRGTDTFTYLANDGFGNSASPATVTLTVSALLSIPTNLTGSPGGVVVVPVNINNPNPDGSGGLVAAALAIDYNPNVFTIDPIAGIQFGTVTNTSDWGAGPGQTPVVTVDPVDGFIGIALASDVPDLSTVGGSLVLLTFQVLPNAPAGSSAINLAATNTPSGGSVTTLLDAANGPLTLRPAVTNAPNDPAVDGSVDVVATTHFSVVAPTSVTTGVPFSYTVSALDQTNNLAVSYAGTVHFSTSDGLGTLSADATLTNGVGIFTATLVSQGSQTISAVDASNIFISGTSYFINVSAGVSHFAVTAPGTVSAGSPFVFEVAAEDQFNNPVAGYTGTIHFTSSDGGAALPADATLTNGVGFFATVLKAAGSQTITATDTVTGTIKGTSTPALA